MTEQKNNAVIVGLTFVELPALDVQASLDFYQEVLGFKIAHLDKVRQWCLFSIPNSSTGCVIYTVRGAVRIEDYLYQHTARMTMRVADFEAMRQTPKTMVLSLSRLVSMKTRNSGFLGLTIRMETS